MMATFVEIIDALKTLIPDMLQDDDPVTSDNWNTVVNYIKKCTEAMDKLSILTPPIGYIYLQFPGAALPSELWDQGSSLWKDITPLFPGAFFRLDGGNASRFMDIVDLSAEGPALEIQYNSGDGGQGGGQMDAIRNITGTVASYGNLSGVFQQYGSSPRTMGTGSGLALGDFRVERQVPVSSEIRPKNITCKIWIRIA